MIREKHKRKVGRHIPLCPFCVRAVSPGKRMVAVVGNGQIVHMHKGCADQATAEEFMRALGISRNSWHE